MDQHEFVRGCLAFYCETGTDPEPKGGWQEAHYPSPECLGGTEKVWMLFDHHQEQGLYQSEEFQCQCFFNKDTKAFLDRNPTRLDLWVLYDRWKGYNSRINSPSMNAHPNTNAARSANGRRTAAQFFTPEVCSQNGKEQGSKNGPKNILVALNALTPEIRSKHGRDMVVVMNGHPSTKENQKKQGAATNRQKWRCLVTGYVSNPGGLTVYQRARGIDTSFRERMS